MTVESAVLTGLAAAVAAVIGLVLVTAPARWLADPADTAAVTGSRAFRPVPLVLVGIAVAGIAGLLFPLPGPPSWTAVAPGSGTVFVPPSLSTLDLVLTALVLGTTAAATPVLIVSDLLVRRLPDRIMYPLIGLFVLSCVLGIVLGTAPMWWFGLIAAACGLLLFGGLHLLGRVMRRPTMGLGDVKLAVVVAGVAGLHSPWAPVLVLVVTMALAGVWAIVAGLRAGSLRGTTIAFGPAMLTGMWVGSVSARFVL